METDTSGISLQTAPVLIFFTSKPTMMNTEMILKSDVLDILFDNRNKLYGAYPLRKFYPERIKTALVIMLGAVMVFCAYTLLIKNGGAELTVFNFQDPEMGIVHTEKKIEQPRPKTTDQKTVFKTQKFVSIIKMEKDSSDKLPVNLDNISIGSMTITEGLEGAGMVGEGNGGGGNKDAVMEQALPAPDPAIPVDNPEVEPSFPGGINALRTFLQRNLVNPRDLEEGEQVSVQVRFVVGYDGKLQHFETLKDGGADFNNEVIRVLKKMPQWIAGKSNGKSVSVYYTIPVKFVPND